MNIDRETVLKILDEAQEYANQYGECKKVAVGSTILTYLGSIKTKIHGANRTLPDSCKDCGCQREKLYGENSKLHRLPSDCRAIHSEIDAICNAARYAISTKGATIVITRYPCEACARAIVRAGIETVYYGREQEISKQTEEIFKKNNVSVHWVKEWTYEDVSN